MKISQFNKRISFYKEQRVANNVGDLTKTNVLQFECWACVKEQYASDVKATIGTVLEDTIQFLVRAKNPVKNDFKIRYLGEFYEIIKVVGDPLGNTHTTIFAKKVG